MRKILLRISGKNIYSYPAMIYLGMVFGLMIGNVVAHEKGLNPLHVFIISLLLLYPGWLATRLLFVLPRWKKLKAAGIPFWDQTNGGASLWGAFPVVLALSYPLVSWFDISFLQFWDVNIFAVLFGMFAGRFGCFLHGCCCGIPSTSILSMKLPNERGEIESRVPIQLLECFFLTGLFSIAWIYRSHFDFDGALFMIVFALYVIGRTVLDFFKEYDWTKTERVTYSIISLSVTACAIWVLSV